MLGQPVLNTVLNERGILSGVAIWFGVHFSPNDAIHRLSNNMYIKVSGVRVSQWTHLIIIIVTDITECARRAETIA